MVWGKYLISKIGSVLEGLINPIRRINFIDVGSFIMNNGLFLFGVAVVLLNYIALLASFGGIKTSTTR